VDVDIDEGSRFHILEFAYCIECAMMSIEEYLHWTSPGLPTKYFDLIDEDKQLDTMVYMSTNAVIWGIWAYKTGMESSIFAKNIGFLATSPHAALFGSLGAAAFVGLVLGITAAEHGGFEKMLGVTPSGDASIMQGVINRWTRNV
jgi:hypothetical protein